MLKKLLLALAALLMTMGIAFAQVDVNKANQAELDSVKGIGPAKSKAIIEERKKGNFKDWADLETRVKGIGAKNSSSMSQAGLTVNGQAKPNAPASKEAKKNAKGDSKESKVTIKEDAKAAPGQVKESVKAGATNVKEGAKKFGKEVKDGAVEVKNKITKKDAKKESGKDAEKDSKKEVKKDDDKK
jgi:competence protein ComEA